MIVEASKALQTITIDHCALMGCAVNYWNLDVKCHPCTAQFDASWQSVTTTFSYSEVKVEHNSVEVTLPPLRETYEIAVFGIPGEKDMKRMQLALYGSTPKKGKNWTINVELYDDTSILSQVKYSKLQMNIKVNDH